MVITYAWLMQAAASVCAAGPATVARQKQTRAPRPPLCTKLPTDCAIYSAISQVRGPALAARPALPELTSSGAAYGTCDATGTLVYSTVSGVTGLLRLQTLLFLGASYIGGCHVT
jgi:hypothetical protein